MSVVNKWYVVTGGPSSGKTTVIDGLAALGYKTHPEAARMVIDKAAASGLTVQQLRADERSFQERVFEAMLDREAKLDRQIVNIFDRGLGDSLGYLNSYGWAASRPMQNAWRNVRYGAVFLLEPLEEFTQDYARTEGAKFATEIHDHLEAAYRHLGHQPILVPKMSPSKRIQFILERINGLQSQAEVEDGAEGNT
ncbi:MAG: ATP-binding protein [Candidatus Saccharimonadales bacterium]